jgi:hypothetical protein
LAPEETADEDFLESVIPQKLKDQLSEDEAKELN